MTTLVAEMTTIELGQLIESIVDRKMREYLSDPDYGLRLRPEVEAQLLQARQAIANGELGRPFDEVIRELGLD